MHTGVHVKADKGMLMLLGFVLPQITITLRIKPSPHRHKTLLYGFVCEAADRQKGNILSS